MTNQPSYRNRLERFIYFFPFQLLWLQFKKNHLLLIFWVMLFGFATRTMSLKFGVPYLLLYPEYLGESGIWAFMILGFALGGFIMAFNIYTYILHAFRFPFLATLSQPFARFSINNFIIPLTFTIVYAYNSAVFQHQNELLGYGEIVVNLIAFFLGQSLFILFSTLYFFRTNLDIFQITGKTEEELLAVQKEETNRPSVRSKDKWYLRRKPSEQWQVLTYLKTPFQVMLARKSDHYDKETIRQVFSQNHVNATFFELLLIVSFLIIGSFRENDLFVIPAMATVLLTFTVVLMLLSVCISWLRSWTFSILLIAFLFVNFASSRFDWANIENHAYGLNYTSEPARYSKSVIDSLRSDSASMVNDARNTIEILHNWRRKNAATAHALGKKPKLVIINCSGGGTRSASWVFRTLQYNDSLLQGALMNHTALITGSSGGIIGASYVRQLMMDYRAKNDHYYNHPYHFNQMASDILNPVIFSLATNDLFIRYQQFELDGQIYTKDRATSFERQLSFNTGGILNKKLNAYRWPEYQAEIPMMIFAPTISNDSRRLIVSAQPMAYLSNNRPFKEMRSASLTENVEFQKLFEKQGSDNVEFLSVLRMNATFPYIMPSVSLPSSPRIQVMDAGLRDNFGFRTTLQFIAIFREWIATNTSGIVIVQVRDKEKDFELEEGNELSIIQSLLNPLGAVYGNYTKMQDYTHDQMLQYTSLYFDKPIEVINFELLYEQQQAISLSWHLTSLERSLVKNSVHHPSNKAATARLRELLLE
jgi:hypothetical protein